MAENKVTDRNATKANADDPLRGGTQGGGSGALPHVGSVSGGTNSISPTGESQTDRGPAGSPAGRPEERHGTYTDSRLDAEDAFEGSRHASEAVAKQRGRDAADADTAPRTPHGAGEPRHHQIHPTE